MNRSPYHTRFSPSRYDAPRDVILRALTARRWSRHRRCHRARWLTIGLLAVASPISLYNLWLWLT